MLSWLRSPKKVSKRPAPYRPMLETLDGRINPTSPHFIDALLRLGSARSAAGIGAQR